MPATKKTILVLHPTRALRVRMSLYHGYGGLLLLATGIGGLGEVGRHFLPWAEILAGGAVLTAILLELRRSEHGGREKFRWVEIMAGLMLMVEGLHARHPGRFFQPALLYGIAGLISIIIGAGFVRLSGGRRMVIGGVGFSLRMGLFRRRRFAWKDISSFEALPDALHLTTKGGQRHTIRLRMVENRDEVVRVFAEHAVRFVRGSSKRS